MINETKNRTYGVRHLNCYKVFVLLNVNWLLILAN